MAIRSGRVRINTGGSSGGGGAPTGSAGGSLTGTYPNPTIATIPSGATATTQSAADASTKIATTAYVDTLGALKANLASPTLTGTPAAPTAAQGTNTTQIATTAMVHSEATLLATLASPTFTGTPSLPTGTTATTQAVNDFSTKLATTVYVDTLKLNLTMAPSGALAFPFDRGSVQGTTRGPAGGTLYLTACYLTAGMVISNLNILPNATSAGITHTWMIITNASRVMVATTNDDTTAAAFTAAVVYTKPITQIASGASATYTVPTTGLYYLGHMQAGTAVAVVAASTSANMQLAAPILGGSSTSGQTTRMTDFAGAQTAITAAVARDHIWPT